jgi:Ran GTPase-activating protein (RanGAP) involved in mRNA processing and transport
LSLVNNTNLTWLDLKDNQLTEEVGKALVDLLQKNNYIEEIVTDGNSFINQPTKEAIYSECRQNL